MVTSPCDNVIHTLVNTSSYTGSFLPGFHKSEPNELDKEELDKEVLNKKVLNKEELDKEERELLCDIDHVTYVCHEGESLKILAFYKVGFL